MKITYLVTGLGHGGAEAEVVQLAKGMRQRGHHVEVVSMLPPTGFAEDLAREGIPTHFLGMRRGVPSLSAIWSLSRVVKQQEPDVLHCFMIHANILGRVTRPFTHLPMVISTSQCTTEGGRCLDVALRLTRRSADYTSNVCKTGLDRYQARRLGKADGLLLIPNSVDVDRFAPDPFARRTVRRNLGVGQAQRVVLAVGRLHPQKGYPDLLAAFRTVAGSVEDATLWIAGDGELASSLNDLARSHGIADRVLFLGRRSEIEQILNAADLFVQSSHWEGMPLALLEAQATGLPAVATAVDGTHEVIEHGRTGLLVPPGNPGQMAAALVSLLTCSDGQRQRMGERARQRVTEMYGLTLNLDRWEQLYRRGASSDLDVRPLECSISSRRTAATEKA